MRVTSVANLGISKDLSKSGCSCSKSFGLFIETPGAGHYLPKSLDNLQKRIITNSATTRANHPVSLESFMDLSTQACGHVFSPYDHETRHRYSKMQAKGNSSFQ